ncbi:MAG: hypothetical protein JXR96_11340 [Deltaproteobacteria bacterium]|nr:hypothetical protein [Deltaproteobacteria bacterium]
MAFPFRPIALAALCALALAVPAPAAAQASEPCRIDDDAIYGQAHLQELARELARIQSTALKNILQPQDKDADIPADQSFTSSAGLFVVYTVHFFIEKGKGPSYLHMVSFSNRGCYLATPYSSTFTAFFHDAMGLDRYPAMASRSRNGVTKLFAILSVEDHQALVKHGVAIPSGKALKNMLVGCIVGGRRVRLGPGPGDIAPGKLCKLR